jgi:hypothetical protein
LEKYKDREIEGRDIEIEGRDIEIEGRDIEIEGRDIEIEGRNKETELTIKFPSKAQLVINNPEKIVMTDRHK